MGKNDFFSNKKVSIGLSYHLKMLKSTLNRGLTICKETSALVNLWVISMDGKSC
jgi:hypothetical protein